MYNITVENFRGIENENVVLDRINVFVGKNGRGKTSMLSAIAFAITGKAKETDIREGARKAHVQITFPNGDVFERELEGRSQTCFLNGKKILKKAAEQYIENQFLCSNDTLTSLMSEDLIDGNVGNMLFQILPLKCSKEKFLEILEDYKGFELSDQEKDILEECFAAWEVETIDFSVIDSLYKEMYERRREQKALLKNAKSRSLFDNKKVAELAPAPILQEKRNSLLKKNGAILELQKRLDDYLKIEKIREKALKDKEEIKENLRSYLSVKAPDVSVEHQAKEDQKRFNDVIFAYQKNKNNLENNNAMLLKVLSNLNSSVCPVHPSISCTTDKSSFRKDFESQISANEKKIQEADAFIVRCQEQVKKREEILDEYRKNLLLFEKKTLLENQLKNLMVPELPEKPVVPSNNHLSDEIRDLEEKLAVWAEFQLAEKAKEEVLNLEKTVAMYEWLVGSFSPKGIKALLIQRALAPLKNECNAIASHIGEQIELDFVVAGKGLDVLAKFHDTFIPVSNLSSGEQVIVLYLIMELIHRITNASIMSIDNLDRLDKENMQKLFDLLEQSQSFKTLLFGSVDHNDTIETLSGRDVQSIEIG